MVDRVYARSTDMEIIFEHMGDDSWKAVIPRNASGQYYLDLYAVDQAGNQTFMAKAVFEVDPYTLKSKITMFEDTHQVSINSDYEFICKEVRRL